MSQLNKMFLQIPLLCMAFLGTCAANAQSDWNASVGVQMSFSELNADNGMLQTSLNPGAGINLGLSYGLTDNWSLHTGLGISYLETSTSIAHYSDETAAVDLEGERFEFRYRLNQYSEKQKSTVLSIPIAFQYESKGIQTRFYSKVGASAHIFLSPTVEGKANRLVTSGFYERFNGELTAPRFAGFGTYRGIQFSENELDIKNSFNAFLEIGVKENIGPNKWIYIGVFAEYGLNNLLVNNNSSLIAYNQNTPLDFINNSTLNSTIGSTNTPFLDKVSLHMIGVRFKYEFGI